MTGATKAMEKKNDVGPLSESIGSSDGTEKASSVILALVFSDTWFAEQNTWVPIPVQKASF